MWASSASRLWECWLPDERPAPNWVRTVSAICAAPPVMNGSFAAWLSSWSRQTPTKSRYISSTTGRMPGHRRADAEAHDRGLRDRRVADAVAEPVVEAPGEAEHVAAGADVDARDEHPLVGGELGFERVVDRVHRAEHRRVGVGARRLGTRRSRAGATKSNSVAGGRAGRALGPRRRPRRARRPPTTRSAAIASSPTPAARSRRGVDDERVARLPLLHLLGRPVALRVALVVAVPAVGGGLDDRRAARRRGRPSTTSCIADAVATTSLPSTAT